MLSFYIRFFLTYLPFLGVKGTLGLHLLVRYHPVYYSNIFSAWFVSILCVSFLQPPGYFSHHSLFFSLLILSVGQGWFLGRVQEMEGVCRSDLFGFLVFILSGNNQLVCAQVFCTDLSHHGRVICDGFLFLHRFIESNWFVWVTQMNHIPMHIDYDKNVDWFSTQVRPYLWRSVTVLGV